jgi:SPP1 family predicted phage head-tail adaptor
MEAGERDRRIVIEQLAQSIATTGFPVETWTTLRTMYAQKLDLSGTERFRADQLSASYDTRWEINYVADMDPNLVGVSKQRRIVHAGQTHDIVAASEIGRREGIELLTLAKAD